MSMPILIIASILSLAAGIYFGIKAKQRPELFWTYLIVGLVYTTGLYMGGYGWYDEIYAIGFLLTNTRSSLKIKRKATHFLFFVFILYMLIQTARGILFYADIGLGGAVTKLRWVLFFIIIFLIFVRANSEKIRNVFDKNIAYEIVKAGLIFSIIYFVFGLLSFLMTGTTGYSQAAMYIWDITEHAPSDYVYIPNTHPLTYLVALFGNTAYVSPILYVGVVAAFMTIKYDVAKRARLAWFFIAVAFATMVFYDSRSGMLMILLFLFIFFIREFRNRRAILGLAVFGFLATTLTVAQFAITERDSFIVMLDLENTVTAFSHEEGKENMQDIKRKIWNLSGAIALIQNPFNFTFGWGLRTSGIVIAPIVYDLLLGAFGKATYDYTVSTPGTTAIAVDIGMLGVVLFLSIWITCLFSLNRQVRRVDWFILLLPTSFFMQLFVVNAFDFLIIYLLIMPGGISYVLNKHCRKQFSPNGAE